MKKPARAASRRVIAVTWPFFAVVLLMLVLAIFSVTVLSAIRSYMAGLATWTGAEADTRGMLLRYSLEPTPQHLADADRAIAIWDGDRRARLELSKSLPDYSVARAGFLAGKNDPVDITGMMALFRILRAVPAWGAPLGIWTQGDEAFSGYLVVRQQMVASFVHGAVSSQQLDLWRLRTRDLHNQIVEREHAFADAINDDAHQVNAFLRAFMVASATLLLAVGYGATRKLLRRSDAMAEALRFSERQAYEEHERAAVLLSSISDAVISTDWHGAVQFLNAAAENLTGWNATDAIGRPIEEVLRLSHSSDTNTLPVRDAFAQVLSEAQITRLSTHSAVLTRRDGSKLPVSERAAPLRSPDGEVIGMVVVMRDVTPERMLSDQLRHQATHDALTGLPNRAQFEHRLEIALRRSQSSGRPYAAMFIDLDQFKIVNDTCGHHAGDQLIRLVGETIRMQLRDDDLLARLGGDEFGLVVQNCRLDDALDIAERIRESVEELRFASDGRTFTVRACVGVVHDDQSLATVADVLCAADRACYAAKDAGRNRVRVYRADDLEIDGRRDEMQWVARLNAALEQDRFILYAQQIRPTAQGPGAPPAFVEVLLRLQDEHGEMVSPMAFIPAAERFGLMPQIDRWVIEHACAEQSRRLRAHLAAPTCMINLSSASIDDLDIAQFIDDRLRHYRLPAGSIGFELTETAAITRLSTAVNVMHRLKDLGCPVALDDFGSGISSYGYLRELPVDILKIHGLFVRDMSRDPVAHAMVEAMHKVARAMGIQTVAEWVEDEATFAQLAAMQVDYAQGRGISREAPWAIVASDATQEAPGASLVAVAGR